MEADAGVLLYAHYCCPVCLRGVAWKQWDAAVTNHTAHFMCCWCGRLGAYRMETSIEEVPCCDIHLEDMERNGK